MTDEDVLKNRRPEFIGIDCRVICSGKNSSIVQAYDSLWYKNQVFLFLADGTKHYLHEVIIPKEGLLKIRQRSFKQILNQITI